MATQWVTQNVFKVSWELIGDLLWISFHALPMASLKDFRWTEIMNDFFKMSSGTSKGPLLIPADSVQDFLRISWGQPLTDLLKICQRLPIYVWMTKNHLWTLEDPNPWKISKGYPMGGVPCRFLEDVLGISCGCLKDFPMDALGISNDPKWLPHDLWRNC